MTLNKLLKITTYTSFGLLISLIVGYLIYINQSPPNIYSVLENNPVNIAYLDRPVYSDDSLLSWAEQAVTTVFKLDFVNYQQSLSNMKVYFTEAGYNAFLQALNESRFLADVISQKLEVSAVVTDTPIILSEGGISEGRSNDYYFWVVEVPVLMTFVTAQASETPNKKITVRLLIERVPTNKAQVGIGINRFWMRDNVL